MVWQAQELIIIEGDMVTRLPQNSVENMGTEGTKGQLPMTFATYLLLPTVPGNR